MAKCQCGSYSNYSECCEPFIRGHSKPDTAEKLMRSRYSAYVEHEIDYIIQSTFPDSRYLYNFEQLKKWSENSQWEKLEIINTKNGKNSDLTGEVEFKAYYSESGVKKIHHELSFFQKKEAQWFFVSGSEPTDIKQKLKVGRNDFCPCGSGKKYKKCCI